MRAQLSVGGGAQKHQRPERGRALLEEVKYFFYITNHSDYGAEQIVALANDRCDQENVIEQLKNGVNAMRMPVDDLLSNWAYMVMSALAWNLKAWYGLLMPNRERGLELLRMEFRRFLHLIVMLPAQIVRSGRRIIYRIMGYNDWLKDFFATWEYLRRMAPALVGPSTIYAVSEGTIFRFPAQSSALASSKSASLNSL